MYTQQLCHKTTNLWYNLMFGRNVKRTVRWFKKYVI